MFGFGINVLAGIVSAASLALLAFLAGLLFTRRRYEAREDAAISSFSSELERAIFRETSNADGVGSVAVARSVVSIRGGALDTLTQFQKVLNSEIDVLASLLSQAQEYQQHGDEIPQHILNEIEVTISVLRLTWPAKKTQIDITIRTMLAQLGLRQTK